jgi:NAD(P)H-flavin reductase
MTRSLLLFACSAVALLPSRQQHKRSVMRMGWGDPPVCEPRPRSGFCARCTPSTRRPPRRWRLAVIPAQVWSEATIKSNTEACAGHRAIELEVPKETAEAFETAGQYVQLTIGEEKPGFYAIASAPGKATFEFLIKENEGNAYLTSLKSGAPVKCSEVSGKGYQTKEHFDGDGGAVAAQYDGFACMNVLFVAGGSGVAPLRSCIEAGVALELPQRATLYYGVRDDSVLAYQDKFDEWAKNYNVDVVTCFSQGSGGAFKGYVQDAIKAKGVAVPRNTGAAVCGPKDMFTATKELLTKEGVFESRVLSNF